MSGRDGKRAEGQCPASAINAYRRQRLNAYPAPKKPNWQLGWIGSCLAMIAIATCKPGTSVTWPVAEDVVSERSRL